MFPRMFPSTFSRKLKLALAVCASSVLVHAAQADTLLSSIDMTIDQCRIDVSEMEGGNKMVRFALQETEMAMVENMIMPIGYRSGGDNITPMTLFKKVANIPLLKSEYDQLFESNRSGTLFSLKRKDRLQALQDPVQTVSAAQTTSGTIKIRRQDNKAKMISQMSIRKNPSDDQYAVVFSIRVLTMTDSTQTRIVNERNARHQTSATSQQEVYQPVITVRCKNFGNQAGTTL